MRTGLLAAVTATLLTTTAAFAQNPSDNLERLGQFKTTGAAPNIPVVPQGGAKADALKRNLEKIKLPQGFHIGLYALVPDARHMAVGPQGVVTFVGTRKNRVYAVTDRTKSGVADEVKPFASTIDLVIPNGPCFSRDGFLFIVEQNRVLMYPAAEFFYESPDVVAVPIVPQGELIPKDEESYNHTARVCRVGPDNKLYIALGQPFNVPAPAKLDLYHKWGIGGIIRMDRDGKNREVYAYGIRNSVGMDFSPKDKSLWFTDNQVDGMGDDQPPGEINRAVKAGQNFGFPWYGGGHTRTDEYKNETPPADVVFPQEEEVAHAADLGMTFYSGKMFPQKYQGAIFSAQHGSWNRTVPVGARVMVTYLKEDGTADGKSEPFAEGWLTENNEYMGRPVDVAQLHDGSLLVSDDFAGALYRIWYDGK
ncbi:MAG: PQQ-dependent sugar dehydrogenase [Hyphomicrobiales bacterium]|nr:PQQ-dependent sugar dehydrogenase [Hyphomicrobiales bacterium]MBV9427403.1 PQQ-dependent sugar dehydrogenase [Bradyrhizobiaceae bacterium]